MNFHTHVKNISRKAGQKLRAPLRVSPYLDQRKSFNIQVNDKISV